MTLAVPDADSDILREPSQGVVQFESWWTEPVVRPRVCEVRIAPAGGCSSLGSASITLYEQCTGSAGRHEGTLNSKTLKKLIVRQIALAQPGEARGGNYRAREFRFGFSQYYIGIRNIGLFLATARR